MSQPSLFEPPQVSWLDPEERDEIEGASVIESAVQQLVNNVWQRIPPTAREMIAPELKRVLLLGESTPCRVGLDSDDLVLFVDDRERSQQWELLVTWLLAKGFSLALLQSIVDPIVHINREYFPPLQTAVVTPESCGDHAFHWWPDVSHPYRALLRQLADAIAVGWGFGKEQAAVMLVN